MDSVSICSIHCHSWFTLKLVYTSGWYAAVCLTATDGGSPPPPKSFWMVLLYPVCFRMTTLPPPGWHVCSNNSLTFCLCCTWVKRVVGLLTVHIFRKQKLFTFFWGSIFWTLSIFKEKKKTSAPDLETAVSYNPDRTSAQRSTRLFKERIKKKKNFKNCPFQVVNASVFFFFSNKRPLA